MRNIFKNQRTQLGSQAL